MFRYFILLGNGSFELRFAERHHIGRMIVAKFVVIASLSILAQVIGFVGRKSLISRFLIHLALLLLLE